MFISDFYKQLEKDVKELNSKIDKSDFLTFNDTVKSYYIEFKGKVNNVFISSYTLRIMNLTSLDKELIKEIKNSIIDMNLLRSNVESERRAFINFLKLKYGEEWQEIKFIDREKPDYCIVENNNFIAYEFTEAISPKEAKFNKMCKYMTGRNQTINNYEEYVSKKYKNFSGIFDIKKNNSETILSSSKGLVDTCTMRKPIIDSISTKTNKAKNYEKLNENNLVVYYSNIGFDNESDYKEVEKNIKEILYCNQQFDRIYISSGLYNTLVEYDQYGNLIRFT